MTERIELLVAREGARVILRSPEVGWFTCAVRQGQLFAPGSTAGNLSSLGRSFELVVPVGVAGRIVTEKPERVHKPVGYGTPLYELAPLGTEALVEDHAPADRGAGAPAFLAPHSGRFWHRPTPNDPAFIEVGAIIEAGQTIGLLEVMKTFTHLDYKPGADLPRRARVSRFVAGDGAEVREGDALIEVEPG